MIPPSSPLTLNELHCVPNFTLKPNEISEFSHTQEDMKGLTAARIGPKHMPHLCDTAPLKIIKARFRRARS
jgi:hypothetical protein